MVETIFALKKIPHYVGSQEHREKFKLFGFILIVVRIIDDAQYSGYFRIFIHYKYSVRSIISTEGQNKIQ